jgi:high-affinity Fe2+/Pb2+ permease
LERLRGIFTCSVNKGYFWIVLAGAAFGCYAGWSLTKLLLNQIYRINNGISTFTLTISVATMVLVALVTTGIKIWEAIKDKAGEVVENRIDSAASVEPRAHSS